MSENRFHPTLPALALVAGCLLVGCGGESAPPRPPTPPKPDPPAKVEDDQPKKDPYEDYGGYDIENITFANFAKANSKPGDDLVEFVFVDREGNEKRVRDYTGEKPVVLLVMRGNTTPICPFCCTQTANYVMQYDEIAKRGAEVLVVYPIAFEKGKESLDPFLAKARERLDDPARPIPFPIVFDVELKAVNALGIRADLSKPATYVVDREGHVRYAYVGRNRTDRPSVKAVLGELDKLDDGSSTVPENP